MVAGLVKVEVAVMARVIEAPALAQLAIEAEEISPTEALVIAVDVAMAQAIEVLALARPAIKVE